MIYLPGTSYNMYLAYTYRHIKEEGRGGGEEGGGIFLVKSRNTKYRQQAALPFSTIDLFLHPPYYTIQM